MQVIKYEIYNSTVKTSQDYNEHEKNLNMLNNAPNLKFRNIKIFFIEIMSV